jgi:hypothetical protein
LGMATLCEKCGRRHLVAYQVEPKEAWRLVVQNRWRDLCPNCFDAEATRVGVRPVLCGGRGVTRVLTAIVTRWPRAGARRLIDRMSSRFLSSSS